ncbi:MAG: protein kinase, partial [Candidatus Poribacteria bacterium]|nr:protein kinase [Candidatus Poribacteria bacterium]
MQYRERWEEIEDIGEGGQGKVIRVFNKQEALSDLSILTEAIADIRGNRRSEELKEKIRKGIAKIVRAENPVNHGALKILHAPDEVRNFADAEERLKRELKAMEQADHPNLLKVLDYNLQEKWFVSRYYPNGTLQDRSDWYTGQVERALTAIRPVVEGVATLHRKGLVHRDIKPENIFVDEKEQLVLGDFGLVFFEDPGHTRISGTLENVGSTDWMPPWATRMRIEDINPSFDVFSLGKTIWAMVSREPILQLWYHREPKFNLEKMFPNRPEMALLNNLLDKCIVQYEHEQKFLKNADSLLEEIDSLLNALRLGADLMSDSERPCRVCGFGKYQLKVNNRDRYSYDHIRNFGLHPAGVQTFKVFVCDNCGNVQLFSCQRDSDPPGWAKSTN